MIAAVMYFSNCQPIGIHRTYLREDGTDKAPINPQKKMLRSIKGGGVWLGVPSQYLIIAEGIETALTCQLMYGMSAVAALSSTNMQHLILPSLPLARTIFIAQDNDDAGRKATEQLANRLYEEGRTVKILTPPPTYNDFNDILQCKQNSKFSPKNSVNPSPERK